jgi:hypothetical protein
MAVETLETSKHTFNLLNRDQSTPLLEPDKWNADTLLIDTWNKNTYICRVPMWFKFNRLPLASKSDADCWVSVPRLLLG